MKKILLVLGLCSSLAFSEVYYKNKDNKYSERDSKDDQIRVNGYVTNVNEWRDYSIITIKQKNGDNVKAKVGNNEGFHENDIVIGTCVNYKYSQYERCSLYRR